jgi:hypothetical protein
MNHGNRLIDGRLNRCAHLHLQLVVRDQRPRLAADDQDMLDRAAHVSSRLQHFDRDHGVRLDCRGWRAGVVQLRFQNVNRPHFAAAGSGGYQDYRLVWVKKGVGQVEPADAKILDADCLGERVLRQATGDLNSECIVTEKDIADAGNQNSRGIGFWCGNRISPLCHSP